MTRFMCVVLIGAFAPASWGETPRGASAQPAQIVDLTTAEGAGLVAATWRHHEAKIIEVDFRSVGPDRKPTGPPNRTYDITPRAGAVDFDDSQWEIIDPTTLDERRSTGMICFNWYRVQVTIPERIRDFPTAGSRVEFETVVDDYAEVWVDGRLPRELGQSGGSLIAGWNAPNRVVLTENATPGQQVQIAIFGINGPISDPPQNYIWMRSARLEFFPPEQTPAASAARIIRIDPRLDQLIAPGALVETVADGFTWLEGPVWNPQDESLLFSDIPQNAVFRWRDGYGAERALHPSGYTGREPFTGREPGSNGLTLDDRGKLVLCEHGDRRIARLESDGSKTTLIDRFEGKRLNSPNDLVYDSNGNLYFTDPPFGLPQQFDDPARELDFSGVFRLSREGDLRLLTKELRAPNGIALSPDEKVLMVSNADAEAPVWMAYPLREDGLIGAGGVFQDARPWLGNGPGLPDGMKFDRAGNLFATGPGGVYVLGPDGAHLGTILTGRATSNCAWGGDGSHLYITGGTSILRLKTAAQPERPGATH